MQRSTVQVARVDGDGGVGQPIGTAELVTRDVAVMETGNRGPEPMLPLLVLFPVAAGGDREERTIWVTEIVPAEEGAPYVALKLAEPAPAEGVLGAFDDETDPMGRGGSLARTVSQVTATAEPRICRWFPWICR